MNLSYRRILTLYIAITITAVCHSKHMYVQRGANVCLKCSIEEDRMYITWLGPPNRTIFAVGNAISSEHTTINVTGDELKKENFLQVSYFTEDYEGFYECYGINGKTNEENMFVVKIERAPTVLIKYETNAANERILRCLPNGIPDNFTFYDWQHTTPFGQHLRYLIDDGRGSLTIPEIKKETNRHHDRGIYICRVSNGVVVDGNIIASKEYHLRKNGKPYFVTSNNATQYGKFQSLANISVVFVSIPNFTKVSVFNQTSIQIEYEDAVIQPVRVLDTIYGKNVSENGTQFTHPILINSLQDFQQYTFEVINTLGASNYTVNLVSAGRPSEPLNVQSIVGPNYIEVKWQAGFNGGFPQSFFIEYQKQGTNNWNRHLAGTINSTIITGLEPDTEYYIRIKAQSDVGESSFTPEIMIKTGTSIGNGTVYIFISLLGVVFFVVVALLAYFGLLKGKKLKIRKLCCSDRNTDLNADGVDRVDNQFYGMHNNLAGVANTGNHELPVYSPIERNQHLRLEEHVSRSVAKQNKPRRYRKKRTGDFNQTPVEAKETSAKMHLEEDSTHLNYMDVCFDPKPIGHIFKIHGSEDTTPYAEVDLTIKVEKLPNSDDDDSEDFTDVEELKKMRRKTMAN